MSLTKAQVKEIARKHVRVSMAYTNVPVSAEVNTEVDANGDTQYTIETKNGNIVPDEDAVDRQAEMLASFVMDLLPLLTVSTVVKTSTTTGAGKGAGSVS